MLSTIDAYGSCLPYRNDLKSCMAAATVSRYSTMLSAEELLHDIWTSTRKSEMLCSSQKNIKQSTGF
jgi:hypothetical protein